MSLSLSTLVGLFVLGLVQSVGPCVINRMVTLSALASSSKRPVPVVASFVSGVVLGYEAFLIFTPVVLVLWLHLSVVYAIAALGFVVAAFWTLFHHSHSCEEDRTPAKGGAFFVGVYTVAQVQPCCLPVAFGIVASSTYLGLAGAAALFAAYAIGHAVPLIALGLGSVPVRAFIERVGGQQWLSYVNAGMLLFMAVLFVVQV